MGLTGLLATFLLGAGPARGAEDIGDISVSAAAIYTGPTAHGYAEARVVLENNSSKTHVVTLTTPNRSYSSGNCISRIARTVTLSPGVTVVVSLLQPPLPDNGDSLIRVLVDGRDEGTTRLPNANSHCAYNRGSQVATAFISRSLDADGIQRMLNHNRTLFSAAMATGQPNTWSGGGPTKVWMPDNTTSGQTNWLELGYDRPVSAYHLAIHYAQPPVSSGLVDLIGISGTNVGRLSLAAGSASVSTFPRPGMGGGMRRMGAMGGMGTPWVQEFSFPTTSEPVKTVRINFGVAPPASIAITGVSLDNSSGEYFADTARASSENTAAAPGMTAYGGRFGGDPDSIQCLRAESALSDWSDNWLAYTPFDAVVLAAGDLTAMPAPVATAIGDYLQAGGVVVILGATSLPAAWNPSLATSQDPMGGNEIEAGFGKGFAITATDPGRLSPATVHRLHEIISTGARYWASLPYDSGAANANLPVVENLKVPVRGITIIMLVFIIVVGPVNMFWLARKNRRTWMLWTIPAISLATTLVIFAYTLVREGITPTTRTAGLTILDQPGHHAATFGATGFYCPLTPSGGLRFDNETEATPLVSDEYGTGSPREVDWTQTQHFQRGWVTSRVPAHFHLRKSEVRRERLEWQKVAGGWQIINGLGAPIKSLWLADQDLHFFAAEDIPAGQSTIILPVRGPVAPGKRGANKLFHDLGYSGTQPGPDVLYYLQPGTYIAVLDGNPFIENALGAAASAQRTRSTGVVYGILDSPATP